MYSQQLYLIASLPVHADTTAPRRDHPPGEGGGDAPEGGSWPQSAGQRWPQSRPPGIIGRWQHRTPPPTGPPWRKPRPCGQQLRLSRWETLKRVIILFKEAKHHGCFPGQVFILSTSRWGGTASAASACWWRAEPKSTHLSGRAETAPSTWLWGRTCSRWPARWSQRYHKHHTSDVTITPRCIRWMCPVCSWRRRLTPARLAGTHLCTWPPVWARQRSARCSLLQVTLEQYFPVRFVWSLISRFGINEWVNVPQAPTKTWRTTSRSSAAPRRMKTSLMERLHRQSRASEDTPPWTSLTVKK